MRRVRITQVDGRIWTRDVDVNLMEIGRGTDSHIQLDHPSVSSRHCLLDFSGVTCIVRDSGSANGTFLNNRRLDEPSPLREGDLLYVGPFLLELTSVAPDAPRRASANAPLGPIVRVPAPQIQALREFDRLSRWATQWEQEGRPARLLLRGPTLREARKLRGAEPPESPLFERYVAESTKLDKQRRRNKAVLALIALGVVASTTAATIAHYHNLAASPAEQKHTSDETEASSSIVADGAMATTAASTPDPSWIEHEVIPAESIADVARRYDVAEANVVRWNGLNPDAPDLEVGTKLRIKPRLRPLPQQQIVYELDHRFDWKTLSEHFDVPVNKLRAYNPDLGHELPAGTQVHVWIDPKPYTRRQQVLKVPEFTIRPDAISVGYPNDGSLENGVQLPESDLYVRRVPNREWGASHTLANLLSAIAHFRQDLDFDGVLVISDLSQRGGGHFSPHKSHQAGRDIDIWMPTLRGVHKDSYLGRERKPQPNEIDWFATWGLIRALIETDQILHIFIEYELQEKVYGAAKIMGATDEELTEAMQWPRGQYASGLLAHSPGHTGHIHVRFLCGPLDTRCFDRNAPHGENDGD